MRFRFVAALAAGSIALLAATSAQAGNPMGGVGISVEQSPGGIVAGSGQTDAN